MSGAAVRAVVFDVGGVLTPDPIGVLASVDEEFGLPKDTMASFIRGGSIFAECELGRAPITEFYRRCNEVISAEHGVRIPDGRLEAMFTACMGDSARPEMVELVLEIKGAGHRTGLMTNIFAERRQWLHGIFPDGTIDVFCDSSEVGMRKPDPAIYDKLLELFGVQADEVVFVDDFPENVAAAQARGIATVLYRSAEQVRQDLIAAGVRIARPAESREVPA